MAKFTPGPTVAEVRGSVGGTTFSRNRYGMYMRNRAVPVVSQTEHATNAKSRLSTASQAWQTLSVANQNSWNSWALSNPVTNSLGQQIVLTGAAAYIGNHCRMSLWGLSVLTTPPTTPAPTGLLSVSVVANKTGATCAVTFTDTPLAADDSIWVDACYVASAGKHWVENLFRFATGSAAAQASPFDILAATEAKIGTMTVGHRLILKVAVFDRATGLLSQPLRCEDTII